MSYFDTTHPIACRRRPLTQIVAGFAASSWVACARMLATLNFSATSGKFTPTLG